MGSEEHSALIRQYYAEAFNTGDLDQFDRFFAPTFRDLDSFEGQAPGPEGVKAAYLHWSAAFADTYTTIDELLAADDRVVVASTLTARHVGPFMGFPATQQQVTVRAISIFRIQDNQIVERRGLTDALGLLRQLGGPLVPTGRWRLDDDGRNP